MLLSEQQQQTTAPHEEKLYIPKTVPFFIWGPPEHCSCTFPTLQPLLFLPPSITQALLQQLLVGVMPRLIRSVAYPASWLQHKGT